MILIADSGSTKTDWCLLDPAREPFYFTTQGFNPYFHREITWTGTLADQIEQVGVKEISIIYYYGAGCNTPGHIHLISETLHGLFNSIVVEVRDDLMGAARALWQDQPGIIVILGTGTNTGIYDGSKIIRQITPMGYLLGDHGSGAVLGKRLLQSYFDHTLPDRLEKAFRDQYHPDTGHIKEVLYGKPGPNLFLAGFVPFLHAYREHPVIRQLLLLEFSNLFRYQIKSLCRDIISGVRMTGSVAYYFRDIIREAGREFSINVEQVEQYPISALANYHLKRLSSMSK
ncbi:MAG: ATPase [Chlorobi bacterium]|nr:ATPase [Chlorobiota bacterium]